MDDETLQAYKYFLNGHTDGQTLLALEDVIKSGLSPEILETAQVRIFDGNTDTLKNRLGFAKIDGVSLLQSYRLIEFPYFNQDQSIDLYEYKPFPAVYFKKDDTPRKYLHPKGMPPVPYILPSIWSVKDKDNKPLWITEGVKKVLKLIQHQRSCIGIAGVWNFKAGKDFDEPESKYLWKEIERFKWAGRTVYIGFDADLWVNPMVRHALYELAFKLYGFGAVVRFPFWESGNKGIDDLLSTQDNPDNTLAELENTARDLQEFISQDHHREVMDALYKASQGIHGITYKALVGIIAHRFKVKPRDVLTDIARRRQIETKKAVDNTLHPYFIDGDGAINLWRRDRDGSEVPQRLANFTARISEQVFEDNGQETAMRFVVVGNTKEHEFPKVRIPATQFATLNFLINHWGNEAIVEPGQNTKDHLRYFIQRYSQLQGYEKRTVYTHTGWRRVEQGWCYLCANGALGAEGIAVDLPGEFLEMGRYCLPAKPENEIEAIKTSLSFLHIGKPEITYPGYVYTFLAPLASILDPIPNFSAYFFGETGSFKSTAAVLLLSHFGNFSISNLSNFDSTANQIEKRAFTLKDTLYVLDDYHPSARQKEATAKEAVAQRLIRACSNRTGRERLNPDSTEKGKYVPRGMLLITGEELVQLQSTLARVMVVEFNYGDINVGSMGDLQKKANTLPHAMASYILWVRDNMEMIQQSFSSAFPGLRESANIKNGHRKINEQVAYLQFTLDLILTWAQEKKALSKGDAGIAAEMGRDVFYKIANKQTERIDQDDPVKLFFDIVESDLNQGKARIDHKTYGYKSIIGNESGQLIGYYDRDYYYLLPVAVWHLVQTYLRLEGGHFPFTRNTLYAVLEKRELIEVRDGKHTIPVKITIIDKKDNKESYVKRVLKIKRSGNDPFHHPDAEASSNDE